VQVPVLQVQCTGILWWKELSRAAVQYIELLYSFHETIVLGVLEYRSITGTSTRYISRSPSTYRTRTVHKLLYSICRTNVLGVPGQFCTYRSLYEYNCTSTRYEYCPVHVLRTALSPDFCGFDVSPTRVIFSLAGAAFPCVTVVLRISMGVYSPVHNHNEIETRTSS
jgi:hypothetical protein